PSVTGWATTWPSWTSWTAWTPGGWTLVWTSRTVLRTEACGHERRRAPLSAPGVGRLPEPQAGRGGHQVAQEDHRQPGGTRAGRRGGRGLGGEADAGARRGRDRTSGDGPGAGARSRRGRRARRGHPRRDAAFRVRL